MDFGPREVLIALGALLVCGIILDGVRRMRAARRGSLRGPRRQSIFDDDGSASPGYDSDELLGQVRVVAYRDEQAAAEVNKSLRNNGDATRSRCTAPFRELDQAHEELVPDQPPVQDPDPVVTPVPALVTTAESVIPEPESDTEFVGSLQLDADDLPLFKGVPVPEISLGTAKSARSARGGKRRGKASAEVDAATRDTAEMDAIVVHLMAPPGQAFSAKPLFAALLNAGLTFGERNIFHSYAEGIVANGEPVSRFSVANALKPGAFEGSLHEFSTPGVAFFMLINDLPDPLVVFDDMLATAQAAARELNAELKDEQRASLTRSGIAHYRQRILDHSRRHGLPD
jgi:cell division protein ZipA